MRRGVGRHQTFGQCHDLRYTRFVICAKQGGPVGHDQRFPDAVGEEGEILAAHHNLFVLVEQDAPTHIFYQSGLDLFPGNRAAGVHMGQQPQHRAAFPGRGDDGGHIAVFVLPDLVQPQPLQLLNQPPAKFQLVGAGGIGFALLP